MKKFPSLLLALTLLASAAGAVNLYVDMNLIDTDTPPTIVDGRTLVPVRAIFEAIGATVDWDSATSTATGVRGDTTVIIQINNTTAYVNGEARVLDVPAQLINDRTMVPARFISEAMGCEVTWDGKTETAAVAYLLYGKKLYATPTGERYHYDGSCNGGTYYETTLAEITGRRLTPCDKCVLTNPDSTTDPDNTPAVPDTAPAAQASTVYTGTGDDVVQIKLLDGGCVFHITGNQDGKYFGVKGYDANGGYTKLFVNTTDPYKGVTYDPDQKTATMEVTATGDWTIELLPLSAMDAISSGKTVSGSGDSILRVSGSGTSATITGNAESHYFGVWSYGTDRDLLVNTTDPYEGTVMLTGNPELLEITATGSWAVTFN